MTEKYTVSQTDLARFATMDEEQQAIVVAAISRAAAVIYLSGQEKTYGKVLKELTILQGEILRPNYLLSTSYYIAKQCRQLENQLNKGELGTEEVIARFRQIDGDLISIREQFAQKAGGSSPLGSSVNLSAIGKIAHIYSPAEVQVKSAAKPTQKVWFQPAMSKDTLPAKITQAFVAELQDYLKTLEPESLEKVHDYCHGNARFTEMPFTVQVGIGIHLLIDREVKIATAASINTSPHKPAEIETDFEKFRQNYIDLQKELAADKNHKRGGGIGGP